MVVCILNRLSTTKRLFETQFVMRMGEFKQIYKKTKQIGGKSTQLAFEMKQFSFLWSRRFQLGFVGTNLFQFFHEMASQNILIQKITFDPFRALQWIFWPDKRISFIQNWKINTKSNVDFFQYIYVCVQCLFQIIANKAWKTGLSGRNKSYC